MLQFIVPFRYLILLTALLLTACGGGGGSESDPAQEQEAVVDDSAQQPAPDTSVDETDPPSETDPVVDDTDEPSVPEPTLPEANFAPLPSSFSVSPHQRNFLNDQDLSTFFEFFNHQNLNQIDVYMTQAEWDAFIADLYRNLESETLFRARVIVRTASATYSYTDAGFRLRGNTTRVIPEQNGDFYQANFKIKFNEPFDMSPNTLAYLERKERRFANMRALNLKSRGVARDDSQIRELYGYDLFNQAGAVAPLTGSARLFVHIDSDIHDFGLYTAIEPIDKSFLRKRFGDDDNEGNLYKCLWQEGGPANLRFKPAHISDNDWIGIEDNQGHTPTYDLKTNEAQADHSALRAFIGSINSLRGDALKAYLDTNFEVDQFLQIMAMNVLIGMPDDFWAMGNNYYLYFNNNGKIQFIPYDYDHAFGSSSWRPFEVESADVFSWNDLILQFGGGLYQPSSLVGDMLAIPEYRQRYIDWLKLYTNEANGNFNYQRYSQTFDQLYALYNISGNGWMPGDVNNVERRMLNGQEWYFDARLASVRDQLEDAERND